MHGFADDVAGGAAAILGDGMLNYLQNIRVPARVPLAIALHSRFASIIGAHLFVTPQPSDEDPNTYQSVFAVWRTWSLLHGLSFGWVVGWRKNLHLAPRIHAYDLLA